MELFVNSLSRWTPCSRRRIGSTRPSTGPSRLSPGPASRRLRGLALALATALAVTLPALAGAETTTLTVYSARNEQLLKPLLDRFTKDTGIAERTLTDKEGPLLARLRAEQAGTPADVLITVDAGNLWQAAREGVLQPIESAVLEKNIPLHLRDPGKQWFGLSVRARTIVYDKRKVQPDQLSSYEDLAEPKWRGKLCLRTSKKVYNQSLVAALIAHLGEPRTEAVVKGWIANLATDVFADDTALLKAMAAGQCQVGLVNTYYLGRLLDTEPGLPIGLFWANQASTGVHMNVSGAGVTRHAKHPAEARRLIEWLSGDLAQFLYADRDLEYPANPRIKPASLIAAWGEFKGDQLGVDRLGAGQTRATLLMDRVGYR